MEDVENGEQKWILSPLSNKGCPLLFTPAGALLDSLAILLPGHAFRAVWEGHEHGKEGMEVLV